MARLQKKLLGRAQREWQAGNLYVADRLLEECPEDLRGWEWGYLYHLCHAERRVYRGHVRDQGMWPLTTLAYSPDGKRVASLDRGGLVKVWDPDTGQDVTEIRLDAQNIDDAAFSPDLTRLAWVSQFDRDNDVSRVVQVWDLQAGKKVFALKGHPSQFIPAVAFSPDGKRLASSCSTAADHFVLEEVKLWDLETGRELLTLGSGRGSRSAGCLAFSPDGRRLATGGYSPRDPAVRVWDIATGKELQALPVDRNVTAVAFSPDGRHLAASCGDLARVWEMKTGKEVRILPGSGPRVAFSPDGQLIASNGPGPCVTVWDVAGGQERVQMRGACRCLAFSPDGNGLATDYSLPEPRKEHWIKVWDADTNPEVRTLCRAEAGYFPRLTVACSPDSKQFAVADLHRSVNTPQGFWSRWSVTVFDAPEGREAYRLLDFPVPAPPDAHWQRFLDAAFSPDGSRLATLGITEKECVIRVYDRNSRELLASWQREAQSTPSQGPIAFCAGGRRLAFGQLPNRGLPQVEVCDAATGASAFTVEGELAPTFAVSPDGNTLATVHGAQVRLWEAATGRPVATLQDAKNAERIAQVCFSPDGKSLALARTESLAVWDAATGRERLRIPLEAGCDVAAFSPDGKRLASGGSGSGTITLWDVKTGKEILTLRGHDAGILRLVFTPDGRFLASSSLDGTVKLWEALGPRK